MTILTTLTKSSNFNPRSREGSDPVYDDKRPCLQDFNPRSREGSDLAAEVPVAPPVLFQSTLP